MARKKIAIISSWYPPVNGIFVYEQARMLSLQYDVTVFTHNFSLKSSCTQKVEKGINVHRSNFSYIPKRTKGLLNIWINKWSKRIVLEVLKEKFDFIHAHNYLSGFVAEKVSVETGIPFFITLHHTDFIEGSFRNFLLPFLHSSLSRASKVITVASALDQAVKKDFTENTVIVPNIVDTNKFNLLPVKNRDFSFVLIGALDNRKGIVEVLDAFSLIDNAKLHLIGDLMPSINIANNKNVIHHGNLPLNQVAKVLSQCHCLISFSTIESFGVTVIEGMSCGLPILYCASGGPEYLVPEYAGIKVNRTVEDLARGMKNMIELYDDFEAEKIRKHAVESYSFDTVLEALTDVYLSETPSS